MRRERAPSLSPSFSLPSEGRSGSRSLCRPAQEEAVGDGTPPGCGGESSSFPAAEGNRCHCSEMNKKKKKKKAPSGNSFSAALCGGGRTSADLFCSAGETISLFLCWVDFVLVVFFWFAVLSLVVTKVARLFFRGGALF